jgi:two-component system, NtrC family, sensor kinase
VRFVERSAALQQVEIVLGLDREIPRVHADADLLKQVLMNILVNAQQAITGPGRITVRTRLHPARRLPLQAQPQPVVEIAVSDTGCGIARANLQRIFDPFYTSKEVGKGTGLGLSVSYGIVKAHGGQIEVESTVGAGSTFHVFLPAGVPVAQTEPGASETIA